MNRSSKPAESKGAGRGGAQDLLERSRKRLAIWRKTYGPEVLYSFAMPAATSVASPLDDQFQLIEADLEKIRAMKALYPALLSDGKYQILLDRQRETSELCYVIEDNRGGIYGYAHMAVSDHLNTRINYRVRVRVRQVYLFDDHIFKPHRRRGLHAFSIAGRLRIAAASGRTEATTIISRTNTASIASYQRFGMHRTATLVYVPPVKRTVAVPARDRVR